MNEKTQKAFESLRGDKYVQTMFKAELKVLEAALGDASPAVDNSKLQSLLTQISNQAIEAKALLGGGAAKASSKSPRAPKAQPGTEFFRELNSKGGAVVATALAKDAK